MRRKLSSWILDKARDVRREALIEGYSRERNMLVVEWMYYLGEEGFLEGAAHNLGAEVRVLEVGHTGNAPVRLICEGGQRYFSFRDAHGRVADVTRQSPICRANRRSSSDYTEMPNGMTPQAGGVLVGQPRGALGKNTQGGRRGEPKQL